MPSIKLAMLLALMSIICI